MIIIAGLGNPGAKYEKNRHNIGFMAADGIFHDEIDLAPGRFRMKKGGGAAGQNGIRSAIAHLGADFRRARMGVGHPGDPKLVHTHVLGDFAKADQPWLDAMLQACADALPFAIKGDDERYQGEVMRLAPAPKFSPRQVANGG